MRIATPAFFCFLFAWNILFHPRTFSLYVSLGLKLVSCRWVLFLYPFSQSVSFGCSAQSCPTLCNPMDYSTPGFPVHHRFLELAQTHIHRISNAIHLIFCHPLLFLPSISPRIRVFSNESVLPVLHIWWPQYWN